MNTSGMIRGYMAKNKDVDEFIEVVINILSKEFKKEVNLEVDNDIYSIQMNNYRVDMSKELLRRLKSPYGIDKFILTEFEKQGLKLDKNRSQYIEYCFGNYLGAKTL